MPPASRWGREAHASRPRAAHPRQRGAVTAEIAVGLTGLAGVSLLLVWAVLVAGTQVRLVDAAGEAARAAARGEPAAVVRSLASAAAPQATSVDVSRGSRSGIDVVTVSVAARVTPPGRWAVPAVTLRASATAAVEPDRPLGRVLLADPRRAW
jgi:hypothetical protein